MIKIKRYFPVLFITFLCALLALVCVVEQLKNPLAWVSFWEPDSGIELHPYYSESEQRYYLFIPPHTSAEEVELEMIPFGVNLSFSDESQRYGNRLADIPLEKDLYMTIGFRQWGWSVTFQVWELGNLPSLYVEAEDGLLAYLDEDKSNIANVSVTMIEADGRVSLSEIAEMNGRGNGTWEFMSKRPYNLTFDSGISVGPFQNVEKLCLLAEFSDESKMRNSLAYYLGQELDIPYSSPYMYTNLFVNGEYRGLYGCVTKQEYKKHLSEGDIQAVFELTSSETEFHFVNGEKKFSVIYGDPETVRESVLGLEAALEQDDLSWSEQIDVRSFALKYTMDEFLGNADLDYASQYFYIDQENVIHCMLPWDYDWTIGSYRNYNNSPEISVMSQRFKDGWFHALCKKEAFRREVIEALHTYFTDEMFAKLSLHLYGLADEIAVSRKCDQARWLPEPTFAGYDISSGAVTTEDFARLFSEYFPKRKAFMLDYFGNEEKYCLVEFDGPYYGNLCVPRGDDLMSHLEGKTLVDNLTTAGGNAVWETEAGLRPQDIETVTEDLRFLSRSLDADSEQEK